jgi:hypothetical protein
LFVDGVVILGTNFGVIPVDVAIIWLVNVCWLVFVLDRAFFISLVQRLVVAPDVAKTLFDDVFMLLLLFIDEDLLFKRGWVLAFDRVFFDDERFGGDEAVGSGGKGWVVGGFGLTSERLNGAKREKFVLQTITFEMKENSTVEIIFQLISKKLTE